MTPILLTLILLAVALMAMEIYYILKMIEILEKAIDQLRESMQSTAKKLKAMKMNEPNCL